MTTFTKAGYACLIAPDAGEPYEHFIERGLFVASQKPDSDQKYQDAILYSRIWLNVKLHGCEYSSEITKKLREMEKNMLQC